MAMKQNTQKMELPFIMRPEVGQILTIVFALSFYFLCMILPLVGPAATFGSGSPGASRAEHATANYATFLLVNLLTLGLGVIAVLSKTQRRKFDGSPFPYYTAGLFMATVVILFALLLGLLST